MGLSSSEMTAFLRLSSGQISDAMEIMDLRRSVALGFRLLGPPGTRIVGTAVTIRQVAKSATESRSMAATRHRELSRGLAGVGDVIVVDVGGRTDVASWGENHGYHCQANGVSGVIVDGATRDAPEITLSGFPTFVKGVSPVKSRWDLKTEVVNGPVTIGTVRVEPGDVVFADETAVMVIAAADRDRVLAEANRILEEEAAVKLAIK